MKLSHWLKQTLSVTRLALISFCIMAVFSIYLHNHDFDPVHSEVDCAPCHWTHTSVNLESLAPVPETVFYPIAYPPFQESLIVPALKFSFYERSPPVLSIHSIL